MIGRIFLFEVRYWLRQPMVYIFLLILALMVFGAVGTENIQIGGSIGSVYRNAPEVVYNFYGIMSFIGLLMVTAFVNGTAIRDFANNTSQIVFSTPISKSQYLIGKFLGSTFIALIPLLGISLGIVIGSWMPWQDPVRIGPNMLAPHVQGFLMFAFPNVLFTSAVIFAVAILARNTIAAFISAIVLMVGYLIAQSLMGDLDNELIGAMLDPFGLNALDQSTKYWTVSEKNSMLLPTDGVLLWNRLVWILVSLGVFIYGYLRFSFFDRKQKATAIVEDNGLVPQKVQELPQVTRTYGVKAMWEQFWHTIRMDLKSILTGPVFIIVMLLGVTQLFSSLSFVTDLYENTTYPVTYNVVNVIEGSLFLYVIIIVTFYSGMLIWKDREAGINDIKDALPAPSWLPLLAKFTTMMVLLLIILVLSSGAGMVTQLLNGYTDLEPSVYLFYLIVPASLSFGFLAMLALFIHTLVNNKYLGYFAFIMVVVLNLFMWSGLDVESNLVQLNGTPGLRYSDMGHFGPFVEGWVFFKTYWWVFGAILLFTSFLFLVRGRETGTRWRMHAAGLRLKNNWKLGLPLLGAWILLGAWGYYNTKVLNTYTTSDEYEELAVRYEKDYKRFEDIPQPHYTDLDFTIDLDPNERSLSYVAKLTARNVDTVAIDSLHLNLPGTPDIEIDIPGAELVKDDKDLDYRIYRLDPPLAPGAELKFTLEGEYRAKGIENSVSFVQLTGNGTFFNNMDLIPVIGYSDGSEISDRNDRRKHKLPPKEPMQSLTDDPAKRMNTYLFHNSDWVDVRTTISTSPDQIAIAPGSLKKEWTADGKRYFRYELDHEAMNFYSFLSARYEVVREKWTPSNGGQPIDVEVYYHKAHSINVPRMVNSMKKALDYYTGHFGPYMHKQVRIIEFSNFQGTFAQAFPGTMPYSESIGFITDLSSQEDIDMVFYVVAHEMGHQYWAHQVIGADMQGGTLLSESMAQYSALMVMEKEYGRNHMRKFLKLESDKYQRARGGETQREQPILQVENQGYIHYNKGSVVLYCMREFLGEDTLNSAFKALVDSFAYGAPPYPTALDMYRELDRVTPDSLTYLLEDNFKYITLYNNRLLSAKSTMGKDSSWTITLELTAEKNHADSLGRETAIPMNDWIDIGFLTEPAEDKEDGELISKTRERLRTGKNTFTYTLPKKPYQAAIDPDHLFFDRVPDDNVKKVE
ncbi:MAG TPA: M1 family aminopeptidase [Flavobacteriales bacterium]|nr:M1 family aminopeptidase [Flavobacteriales bacterium]